MPAGNTCGLVGVDQFILKSAAALEFLTDNQISACVVQYGGGLCMVKVIKSMVSVSSSIAAKNTIKDFSGFVEIFGIEAFAKPSGRFVF